MGNQIQTIEEISRAKKQGRQAAFLMDTYTERQVDELRKFWGLNQTRVFEIAIDFWHDDMKARQARGEISGKLS